MKSLAILLLGIGMLALLVFYLGAIKGEIKLEPGKVLTGSRARMIGLVGLVLGLAMVAAGGYLAFRVLGL